MTGPRRPELGSLIVRLRGEELEQTIARMFGLSPPLVAKLKEILYSK